MEIEIKVKIENSENLSKFLEKEGRLEYTDKQIDKYYTPIHKNFVSVNPVEEWLRLRNSNGKYSINYKKWHYGSDGKSNHCDEHQSTIENWDEMNQIFDALSFKHLITVNKNRSAWTYKDYEIAFDRVDGLGDFIEIEYKGNDEKADSKEITNKMIDFLENLDCGKIERDFRGYPYLLLEIKGLLPGKE